MNCAQDGASFITKHGPVEKKMPIYFEITPARAKRIQSTLKVIFKFVLTQMTWAKRRLVRNLIHLQYLQCLQFSFTVFLFNYIYCDN